MEKMVIVECRQPWMEDDAFVGVFYTEAAAKEAILEQAEKDATAFLKRNPSPSSYPNVLGGPEGHAKELAGIKAGKWYEISEVEINTLRVWW